MEYIQSISFEKQKGKTRMTRSRTCPRWVLIALTAWLPAIVQAQWTETPPPVDSPYWWTLSDEITPDELRQTLQSREDHVERYLEARQHPGERRLSDEEIERLMVFLDGSYTPQLFPMWGAFNAFAVNLRHREEEGVEAEGALARLGMSRPGVETLFGLAYDHLRTKDVLIQSLAPKQQAFVEILRKARQELNPGLYARVRRERDIGVLSTVSGLGIAELEDLQEAWLTDPAEVSGPEHVKQLKLELTESDWEILRRFLLENVASGMSVMDYDAEDSP